MKILILKPIAEAEQNTMQRMDEFIGCKGEVITTIPTEGFGEVLILSQFGSNAIPAKTVGKRYFARNRGYYRGSPRWCFTCTKHRLFFKTKIIRGIYWLGGGKNVVTTDDGKKIKIIRGRYFRSSTMQRAEPLSLLNYKLEVGTRDTYTKQGVPVTVNGVSIIKVGSTIEEVSTATEQYLEKKQKS